MIFLLLFLIFILSAMISGILRGVLAKWLVMDIPNDRSSHDKPIPRGGGVAIVLCFGISLWLAFSLIDYVNNLFFLLFVAAVSVAVIGFMDDLFCLKKRIRMLVHFIAALSGISLLASVSDLGLFLQGWQWLGYGLLTFYLVWLLNLYNFMDGINGLAAVEAISVLSAGALLSYLILGNSDWVFMLLLASACAGFLVWNFPAARLFMGDTGSCFLGLLIGFISLDQGLKESNLFYAWLILLGVFIVDASFTLARRILVREKFYQAHRSHAYQVASRLLVSHTPVTLWVLMINLCYLLPIAFMVVFEVVSGIHGVILAYTPLIIAAFYLDTVGRKQLVKC